MNGQPLWSDEYIRAKAAVTGNPYMAAAMRSIALEMRHDYEKRIFELETENRLLRQNIMARLAEEEAVDE